MKNNRMYAVLIKHGWGVMRQLMTYETVDLIKEFNGAAVLSGYDQTKYIACLVFQTKFDRDEFAETLRRRGFDFDTRDDAII